MKSGVRAGVLQVLGDLSDKEKAESDRSLGPGFRAAPATGGQVPLSPVPLEDVLNRGGEQGILAEMRRRLLDMKQYRKYDYPPPCEGM